MLGAIIVAALLFGGAYCLVTVLTEIPLVKK